MDVPSRVLVVDNYDSFTFNLVHEIRKLIHEDLLVVKNDDCEFLGSIKGRELKARFDLIVLSPGPGNPFDDVGCVTEYIISDYLEEGRAREFPVLFGVCMGYEAIGVRCGIKLVKTVPRHGLRWKIEIDHPSDADTLLRGLPEVVEQVRYHSWILDPQDLENSSDLIVTSRCFDVDPHVLDSSPQVSGPGMDPSSCPSWRNKFSLSVFNESFEGPPRTCRIPMSFRHRRLPIYGVQFHPESILSERGSDIIVNACKMAGLGISCSSFPLNPSPPVKLGRTCNSVCKKILTVDPRTIFHLSCSVYESLFLTESRASVWLDSSAAPGRYSFLAGGLQAGPAFGLHLLGKGGSIKALLEETIQRLYTNFSVVKCENKNEELPAIAVPCLFPCLGYECSELSSRKGPLDAVVIEADRVLAFDSKTGEIFALFLETDPLWFSNISAAVEDLLIRAPEEEKEEEILGHLDFFVRDSKSSYIEKVKACKAAIAQGESYELCLTTRIESSCDGGEHGRINAIEVFKKLRIVNPSPYGSFFNFCDEIFLLSASPERFLTVNGKTGIAQVKPMKGTRPRGRCLSEDIRICKELSENQKDLAENLMIVDLVRNDLSTVCHNTVTCPSLMQVESFAPYHQLVSTVQGHLKKGFAETVLALFPPGSMTGAPKLRSMQILESLEHPRGLGYSGACGYISPVTGDADLAVNIRSIFFEGSGKKICLGVGGAIVALSDPEEEWNEILVKARKNLSVLSPVGVVLKYHDDHSSMFIRGWTPKLPVLVSTMRFERDKGIFLFQRHIDRLVRSIRAHRPDDDMCCLEEKIIHSISKKLSSHPIILNFQDCVIPPLNEGPFPGIANTEQWTPIPTLLTNVNACRIRIEIDLSKSGEVLVETHIAPLTFTPIEHIIISPVRVDSFDSSLCHKTNNWFLPLNQSREETLFLNQHDEITETGIANVACRINDVWFTPPIQSPCLPGVLRNYLVERGFIQERCIKLSDLTEFICFNSIRGVYTVKLR